MNIVYVSSVMDNEDFRKLFENCEKIPGQQAQKFHRLMIEGLASNGINVKAITGRPITIENCKKRFLHSSNSKKKMLSYHYCSMINIAGIKVIWQFFTSFFNVWKELGEKDSSVVIDVLNASVAYGAATAARIRKKKCIGIVTDLPHLMVTGTKKMHVDLVNRVIKKCTEYILLTEAMNEVVNLQNKPFVIIEGLCDSNMSLAEKKKEECSSRICMYAGLLDARYGVKNLVEGFILANLTDVQLHIYGDGPYVPELEAIVKKNNNVLYMGTVMNEEVVEAELKATLLINPRPTKENFTKYSFPSKNMEYMVSGTPLVTTKLPGMPKEYYPYVYLFEGETSKDIAKTLRKIMEKSCDELWNKGESAKKFVLEEKNNIAQALKVINMCERG